MSGPYSAAEATHAADILMTADIHYWAASAAMGDDNVLHVAESAAEEDAPIRASISPTGLLEWLHGTGPAALIAELGSHAQKAEVALLAAGQFDDADIDAELADYIVQHVMFGTVKYS